MSSKEPIILPEKYYLDYFNYLLGFVEKHYEHVLDVPEYLFMQNFNQLSEDAKCLYLRFSNRRGDFFRINKINYQEIGNMHAAKEELLLQEFIDINESLDPIQFNLFTKAELTERFNFLDKKERKAQLLLELTEEDVPVIFEQEEIAEVKKNQEVEFLKLLFFGNRYNQMTEFVIRDVGNIKLRQLDESKFKPWFNSREEALGVMHISQLIRMVKEAIQAELPIEDFLDEMPWREWLKHPKSKDSAEKLLLKIGEHFERIGVTEEALKYYALTELPPSNERQIRIMEKLGMTDEAIQLAQDLVENPTNATELTFATDYLNRSGVRINRSMTKRLQTAPMIEIPKRDERVENEVLAYFEDQGWQGIHSENFLWRSLFGLIFWEELFNEEYGTFHHPLQRQPSDLRKSTFFESRKEILEERINSIKSKKGLLKYISAIHEENHGIANRFVYWHDQLPELAETAIKHLPLKGLKKVMLEIAKQTKENSTGFPDLFIWNESDYHFYEVKSPNDHLSAQQLFWLDFLSSVGIKAEIMRVSYSN